MDIAPPPCFFENIEPPPIMKNKRQLKKLRYRANKRAQQITRAPLPPAATLADLKDRLHKRIGMNKKGLAILQESLLSNRCVDVDKLLKQMGINDEATKHIVRQMLQKYQEE